MTCEALRNLTTLGGMKSQNYCFHLSPFETEGVPDSLATISHQHRCSHILKVTKAIIIGQATYRKL